MNRKMYYGECSHSYSTIFLDEDFNFIDAINENDGGYNNYLESLFNHFGIEIIRIDSLDKVLKKYAKKLEMGGYESEIDYKSLKDKILK